MADQTETVSSGGGISEQTAVRLARIGLVAAGLGALIVVLNPFGFGLVGLFAGLIGALMALPLCWGQGWYKVLLISSVAAFVAKLIAGPHQSLGGWLAVIIAVLMLVGATLSYPMENE